MKEIKLNVKEQVYPFQDYPKKVICLVGKAGTGKDTIVDIVCKLSDKVNRIVSYTSRPQREGEIEGKDYYFITKEEFLQKIVYEEMLEHTQFNGWYYGIGNDCLSNEYINIGVFNPAGLEHLLQYKNIYPILIYIEADNKIRLERQLNREEHPDVEEIIRRYGADNIDFADYKDLNPFQNNTPQDLVEIVMHILNLVDKLQ